MIELSALAVAAASIISKASVEAASKKAGESGWEVVARLRERVLGWFAATSDDEGQDELDPPEVTTPLDEQAVAAAIQRHIDDDDRFEAVLQKWLEEITDQSEPAVAKWLITARDNAKVVSVETMHGGTITL